MDVSHAATKEFSWLHLHSRSLSLTPGYMLIDEKIIPVFLEDVDGVRVIDHRHPQQEQVSVPDRL